MLTYKEVLFATTKILSVNFEEDIFIDTLGQGFDKSCFFVSIIPVNSINHSKKLFQKSIIIEIKYFSKNDSKSNLFDIAEKLEKLFNLNISVKDRVLTIKDSEVDVLEDEAGRYLSLLLTLNYFDSMDFEKENHEPMGSLEINVESEG